MKGLSPELIKRLDKLDSQYSRSIPLSSKRKYCTKQIFWARVGKILNGKYLKIRHKDRVTYLIVLQVVSRAEGDSLTMYGLSKNLDWSSGISISLCGLNYLLEVEKIKLGYNDLLLIEYEEVTQEEFINLVNSFA